MLGARRYRNAASKVARLTALETQLQADLRSTVRHILFLGRWHTGAAHSASFYFCCRPPQVSQFERPAFTWAAIAGDMCILHAIAEAGLLKSMPVIFVDTLHLFPETTELLHSVEKLYGFKAVRSPSCTRPWRQSRPPPSPSTLCTRAAAAPAGERQACAQSTALPPLCLERAGQQAAAPAGFRARSLGAEPRMKQTQAEIKHKKLRTGGCNAAEGCHQGGVEQGVLVGPIHDRRRPI